jgi:predicted dehydrogenase
MTHSAGRARIAVIGAGWWATYTHIPALLDHSSATLVALCDSDGRRLDAAAQAFGIARTYHDHREMLSSERPDGVVVATSHTSHYAIAKDCLEGGVHVLLEKPMTLSAVHARELVELAKARGVELVIGYPWHYNPHVRRAREVLASGALGAVQFVNCVFSSGILGLLSGRDGSEHTAARYPVHGPGGVYGDPSLSGGGMGHLQITHSAGLMFFVSGLRARRAFGLMNPLGLRVDVVDAINVEFEGGALGIVGGTGNGIQRTLDVHIHCERGCVLLDMIAATTLIRGPNNLCEEVSLEDEQAGYPRFAPARNLVDLVVNQASNGSPSEVGWRTVELLEAAYCSATCGGQPVMIEDLYRN